MNLSRAIADRDCLSSLKTKVVSEQPSHRSLYSRLASKLYSYSFSQHKLGFVQDLKDFDRSQDYNDMFENDEDDN